MVGEVLTNEASSRDLLLQESLSLASALAEQVVLATESLGDAITEDRTAQLELEQLLSAHTTTQQAYRETFADYTSLRTYALATSQTLLNTATGEDEVSTAYLFALRQAFHLWNGELITSADLVALRQLASACPAAKGEGVFTARSLVSGLDGGLFSLPTWCDESGMAQETVVSTQAAGGLSPTYLAPNPARPGEQVRLQLAPSTSPQTVVVADALGRILQRHRVPISGKVLLAPLAGGNYFVRTSTGEVQQLHIFHE